MTFKKTLKKTLRIIGGKYRSRKIVFWERPDLRPTPDRVRETLFNWLGVELQGKTGLDLFAGSGALGFEALSRGAKKIIAVDSDLETCQHLLDNQKTLQIPETEYVVWPMRFDRLIKIWANLPESEQSIDFVFCDPPFQEQLWGSIVKDLIQARVLKSGSWLYLESNQDLQTAVIAHFPELSVYRTGRASKVWYYLFQYV